MTPRATVTISLPHLLPEPPSQWMEETFLAPPPEFGWVLVFGDPHPHFLPLSLGTGEPLKLWKAPQSHRCSQGPWADSREDHLSLSVIYTNTGTSKRDGLQMWQFEVSAKWGNVDKDGKNMCKNDLVGISSHS